MASPDVLDSVQLNFSTNNLLGLNLALAIIMFGVALELKWSDFQYLEKNPKGFDFGVFAHNFLAFANGFLMVKRARLPFQDVKTIAIKTGIQNSGLGLVLIFSFFSGLRGMALFTAWWGIWDLISGIIVTGFWRKYS